MRSALAILILSSLVFVIFFSLKPSMAANPIVFTSPNNTYQNQNLENDNSFAFLEGANISFDINITKNSTDLANATFVFNGVNYTETLQDGLQAWYKFNEMRTVGTKVIDYTGHGYDGSLSRTPNVTWASNFSGAPTKFGDSLYFHQSKAGVGHGLVTLTPSGSKFNITDNFTISMWIYNNQSGTSWILSKRVGHGTGGCNFRTISITLTAANLTQFVLCTNSTITGLANGTTLTSSNGLANGGWTFLTITYNATYQTIYYNASVEAQAYKLGVLNFTTDTWKIASLDSSNGGFNGSIDDLRIWNRSLNQTEIQQIYQAGTGGGTPNVVYQYPDGNYSSRFFINLTTPSIGIYPFKWYGFDFTNAQNSTDTINLGIFAAPALVIQTNNCALIRKITDYVSICIYNNGIPSIQIGRMQ